MTIPVKMTIDKLEDVAEPLREHYAADKGKFTLLLQGEHPKVTEFRTTNVELARELEELRPLKARLAELEKAKPDARIAELEAALATEKAARATAQASADASVLRSAIADKFLKTGGRPSALDYIVSKAREAFTVENGIVVGRGFDPARPGEKLTIDSFISAEVRESDFAFLPSQGGGAHQSHGGGHTGSPKELVNPTPQELGAHADAIRKGDVKIRITT